MPKGDGYRAGKWQQGGKPLGWFTGSPPGRIKGNSYIRFRMYKPSLWFVALSLILLTAALLAGKSHLLVPAAGSCILLGYGYAVVRQRKEARNAYPASGKEEMQLVERQRYLLAKEAILDGAKRKRLRQQPRKQK